VHAKQRLELTWIGKENRAKLEPRVLLEDQKLSYLAAKRVTDNDLFDNRLIFGDNLLALKALEQEFTGRIKCIYIDPPFNTQQAFEHYDDTVEHSTWLSLMRDRLEMLRRLLASDGTLFVHIDDNELGYLIVLLDELFGRDNRLYIITFKQGSATGHKSINPGCVNTTNFLLIYAKDRSRWQPNRVFTGRERDARYGQFIENIDDPFTEWRITTLTRAIAASKGISEKEARALSKTRPEDVDDFIIQNARQVIRFARPSYEGVGAGVRKLIDQSKSDPNEIFRLPRDQHSDIYLRGGERILFYADKLKQIDGKMVPGEPLTTLWDDILSNNLHNEGGVAFPKGKKPEGLVKRVLDLVTQPGDWVLDSFAGSGTTGSVAHKMRRQWIMVEMREHCHTLIIPRLKSVIDGTDGSGVTQATGWEGGGGFRYVYLAPSLLEKDRWGNWVISKKFNATMLAEACCKLEGFQYAPSDTVYWQHGHSTERDFIYVTTQHLNADQLAQLSDEVGSERTLLVLCPAFRPPRGGGDRYPNLTVKKIPKAVLARCEWGHDDYSLKVENLPKAPPPPLKVDKRGQQSLFNKEAGK
jgi:adenine-specific DNA-methyltransferase